jgi:hypothetical protein
MFVRWLGAFGKKDSLKNSLEHELTSCNKEVACEIIKGRTSFITHARVGLQVSQTCILKSFNGDCWSKRNSFASPAVAKPLRHNETTSFKEIERKNELEKTRNPKDAKSSHKEAWALTPCYKSIMVKRVKLISETVLKDVFDIAAKHDLPVYEFETGRRLS